MDQKTSVTRIRTEAQADDAARRVEALLKADPFSPADDAEVLDLLNELTDWVARTHAHHHRESEEAFLQGVSGSANSDAA